MVVSFDRDSSKHVKTLSVQSTGRKTHVCFKNHEVASTKCSRVRRKQIVLNQISNNNIDKSPLIRLSTIFKFSCFTLPADAAPQFNCLKEVACVADGFLGLSMGAARPQGDWS